MGDDDDDMGIKIVQIYPSAIKKKEVRVNAVSCLPNKSWFINKKIFSSPKHIKKINPIEVPWP